MVVAQFDFDELDRHLDVVALEEQTPSRIEAFGTERPSLDGVLITLDRIAGIFELIFEDLPHDVKQHAAFFGLRFGSDVIFERLNETFPIGHFRIRFIQADDRFPAARLLEQVRKRAKRLAIVRVPF